MVKIHSGYGTDIKLSATEVKRFGQITKDASWPPTKILKTQVLDVFIPQIKEKAEAAAADNASIKVAHYAEDLCFKLAESLDSVMLNGGYMAKGLSDILNETVPMEKESAKEDIYSNMEPVTFNDKTPKKEHTESSYEMDEMTDAEKARTVLDMSKECLSEDMFSVVGKFLEGKKFEDIASEMQKDEYEVQELYREALKNMRAYKRKNPAIEEFYYDDINKGRRIQADKNVPVFIPDGKHLSSQKIHEIIMDDKATDGTFSTLNVMLRQQSRYGRLFFDKKVQEALMLRIAEHPDYKIHMYMGHCEDMETFFKTVENISNRMFGQNVFQLECVYYR